MAYRLVLEHPQRGDVEVGESMDELVALFRLYELVRVLRRDECLIAAQRDVWIGSDGALREGVALRLRRRGGDDPLCVRAAVVVVDDPQPFEDRAA